MNTAATRMSELGRPDGPVRAGGGAGQARVDPNDERKAAAAALIGLVRVSTDKQNTQRQHGALGPFCLKVFSPPRSTEGAAPEIELCPHSTDD
ncbi:hypothetical protein [Actinomadura sp. 21ATH]|uniref:hypothetical protein n=1 Tax=Actinomadura sp. 21ATH TaxID=1735444 RepID=UPI0035C1F971